MAAKSPAQQQDHLIAKIQDALTSAGKKEGWQTIYDERARPIFQKLAVKVFKALRNSAELREGDGPLVQVGKAIQALDKNGWYDPKKLASAFGRALVDKNLPLEAVRENPFTGMTFGK